ncbi:MAG: hypothetical protein WC975_05810 [Phycisphaerae bacterium]
MTTEKRLEKLERELAETKAGLAHAKRLARGLLAVMGLAVGTYLFAGVLMAKTASAQVGKSGLREVRATAFFLEDENGKVRARLTVDKVGPMLLLLDENGKFRAELNGSRLLLRDENEKRRVALFVGKAGPVLGLFDENEKPIWRAP